MVMSDMIPRWLMWSGPEARQTPQRGCRPLVGLAAAAEEEQREWRCDACHVVTVTPSTEALAKASISKITWRDGG